MGDSRIINPERPYKNKTLHQQGFIFILRYIFKSRVEIPHAVSL